MAVIKKMVVPVKPVVSVRPVTPIKTALKPIVKVAKQEGFEIVDVINTIELVAKGGGGGRGASPFAMKVFGLENGQGFKITDEKYNAGKGVASLYAGAKRRGMKLRVRRDTAGQLWLFRVTAEQEQEAAEREAARQAEEVTA
jgi:hypothetical protein